MALTLLPCHNAATALSNERAVSACAEQRDTIMSDNVSKGEERTITIEAPAEVLRKWDQALRSGKYKQGIGALMVQGEHEEFPSYCCLGVLEHCLTGEVEYYDDTDSPCDVPSIGWLRAHGITFHWADNNETANNPMPDLLFGGHWRSASSLNDNDKLPFAEIADLIKNHSQATD